MRKMIFVILRHLKDDNKFGASKIDMINKEQLPLRALFVRFHPVTHLEEYISGGSLEERLLLKNKLNEL